MAFFWTGGG